MHQRLRVPREHRVPCGPDVPHGPRPAPQRPRHREDRRTRVAGGAYDDAEDPAPVLVALRARHGQQPCDVLVLEGLRLRHPGEVGAEPDVDEPQRPGVLPRRVDEQPGLVRPEGHRHVGAQRLPRHLARVGVDAARQVDGDDDRVGAARGPGDGDGVGPEPALPSDAGDAVEDEVGEGEHLEGVVGDPPARRPERREPALVGALPEQYGRDAGCPAGRAGRRLHSVSPPLSPLPTSSTTLAPYTRGSNPAQAAASPAAARCIRAPSGRRALSAASAARTVSTR